MRVYNVNNISLFFISSLLAIQAACTGTRVSSTNPVTTKTPTQMLITSTQPSSTLTPSATDIPASSTQQLKQPSLSPTPIITATLALKRGALQITPFETHPDEAQFDLDSGEVVDVNDPRADIQYHRYEGKGRQAMVSFGVVPINKAKLSSYDQSTRSYEDCLVYVSEFTNYGVDYVTYHYDRQSFCVLTNQNRLALLIFQQSDEGIESDNNSVQFKYVISTEPIEVK